MFNKDQLLILRAAMSYMLSNINDVNEAFEFFDFETWSGQIEVGGTIRQPFTESEVTELLGQLSGLAV